jgi:PEP-CTERM motif-containing protein
VSKLLVGLFILTTLALPSVTFASSSAVVTAPEPASGLLIAAGVGAGIAALRRRRAKK